VAYRRFVQRRPIRGREAFRFPQRGVGVPQYRESLHKAGIDPDQIGSPLAPPAPAGAAANAERPATGHTGAAGDPTENPAHYLGLLEELHDNGVLSDEEYQGSRLRLLERLRS
jgi:hypothetical protein